MATTTTSTITSLLSGYVYRTPLAVQLDNLVHVAFALRDKVPANSGARWNARRFTKLTKQTSGMTEGVTGSSNTGGVTEVTINLTQYGNYYVISDVATQVEPIPLAQAYGPLLQRNVVESLEKIVQAIIVGGTNVAYANGVAARANVVQKLVSTDLDKALGFLAANNYVPITDLILPSGGIATSPVARSAGMIVHPDVARDLAVSITGFTEVHKYSDPTKALPGEVGSYRQLRVFQSTLADDGTGQTGGAGTTVYKNNAANFYVYLCPIFGMNAYAAVDFSNLEYTEVTGASDADPLAQRKSYGWKLMFGAGILNQSWLYRLECAASI